MHATRKTGERWLTLNRSHEPCPASDRVPLDMITSLKLLPIRRRYERHCHAVSPPMGVSPGPGQEEEGVRLSRQLGLQRDGLIHNFSVSFPTLGWSSGKAKFEKLPLLDFGFLMIAICCSISPSPSRSAIWSSVRNVNIESIHDFD